MARSIRNNENTPFDRFACIRRYNDFDFLKAKSIMDNLYCRYNWTVQLMETAICFMPKKVLGVNRMLLFN